MGGFMASHDGLLREWLKRYTIEYIAALAFCIAAAAFCIPLARGANSELIRFGFMAVPTVAILVMAGVVLRQFWRVDEFMRRLMLECFAIAGAFAFIATLVYGIFEIAGFPKISAWWMFWGTTLVWNLWMLRAVRR
jgi:hypothetical protein